MSERLSPKPDICYSWENTSPSQEEIEDYLSRIKEEYEREQKENSLERTTGLSYVRFISKSNGRNRKPRQPREIELIRHNGRSAQVKGDGSHYPLDKWAQEAGIESANELVWAFRDEFDRAKEK